MLPATDDIYDYELHKDCNVPQILLAAAVAGIVHLLTYVLPDSQKD
jgi:hypothetical protein